MKGEKIEGLPSDDNQDLGVNDGYMHFGMAKEESSSDKGKPEEELENLEEEGELEEEEPEEEEDELEDEPEEEEEEDFLKKKVSPELEKERKNLLKSYTSKMKEVGGLRLKANLVDAIDANPEAVLRELALRYKVNLGEAREVQRGEEEDLSPRKDEEMPAYIARLVKGAVKTAVSGVQEEGKRRVSEIEGRQALSEAKINATLKYLDDTYDDWGLYEKKMIALVTKHPSLATDPDELYQLARGTGKNLRVIAKAKKEKEKAVRKVKSGSRPTGTVVTSQKGKIRSFDEAWNQAKRDLGKGK